MILSSIRFELLELLGEGGQGRVYKALRRDRKTGLSQIVALKILNSQTAVDLWRREFESLSRVRSPYCVQVHSFERFRGRPALVLEYVEGLSLAQLAQGCWLTTAEIDEILAQLEMALKALRDHSIFHGDLSPHNILVDTSGHVRVLDFGLANLGGTDGIRVTPDFAAPERLRGEPPDLHSDLYSLGRIEQCLRGSPAIPVDYMNPHPGSRRFRELVPQAPRQATLAKTVRELRSRRKIAATARTRTQAHEGHKRAFIKKFATGLAASLMVMATSSARPTRAGQSWSTLMIVTKKWHWIRIDDGQPTYAPVKIALTSGTDHRIEWRAAHGSGRLVIHMKPHKVRTLTDRDFLH